MNRLPLETRVRILHQFVEGASMRAVTRTVGVSINTVTKLLVEGAARLELSIAEQRSGGEIS